MIKKNIVRKLLLIVVLIAVSLFFILGMSSNTIKKLEPIKPEGVTIGSGSLIIGVDVSEGKEAESKGVQFKDKNGQIKPALQIFKDHGYTWVRIRIMIDPASGCDGNYGLFQDLNYVKAMALDAKNRGFKFLLDFHYSHWWADPGNQWTPPRWQGQNLSTLANNVYNYTRDVVNQLKNAGACPDMVQIGNEVDNGMLWEVGRISGGNYSNFVTLANKGYDAVKSVANIPVMIHVAEKGSSWFSSYNSAGGKFDVIGISYYPMWHGSFNDLKNRINSLGSFGKDIYVVESAYYWDTNECGYSGSQVPYPQTQQGQYDYLQALKSTVLQTNAKGIFYWGACWSQSWKWLDAPGWSNDDASRRSLFDDDAKATLGIDGLF
jgi:arabinogalactan endo-1,4-beta-galactosidase